MRAKELEADANIDVPKEIGIAVKALATGTASAAQQQAALAFIEYALCATDRMSFILADDIPLVMAWREGRRFVGLQLRRIIATPMPEPVATPARPITNTGPKARRSRRDRHSPGIDP